MDPLSSFSGLASGIQWRDLVDQIIKADSARQLSPVQDLLARDTSRKMAWGNFNNLISKFSDAAKKLRDGTAFRAFTTTAGKTSTGQTLFSASASDKAAPGDYQVEVVQLARAEKLNGKSFGTATTALNLAGGEFWINGKRVEVASTDTLTSIRDKINAVNRGTDASGVTATILSTGADSHRLILTAANTGSRGIELVDGAGADNALQQLGVLTGTTTRNASPTDSSKTESQRFASKTTYLSTLLGVQPEPAETTVSFGGVKVNVNLATDSLISVMNRVNAKAGSEVASMVEENVGGKTMYRLSVQGEVTADADGTFPADSQRMVELMGFVRGGRAAEISAGQDAKVRIDGFTLTRRTNTVSDAISGVTLDLTAANGNERTSSISGTGLTIKADPKTISAGSYAIALTPSGTAAQQVTTSTNDLVVSTAPDGLPQGTYDIEISSQTTRSTSASTTALSVASAPNTVAAGTYTVEITKAASKAATNSATVNTTFTGSTGEYFHILDNTTGISARYTLTNGQPLDSVVAGLNNMFSSNGMKMNAVNDGGKLKLESSEFGSRSFTVANSHSSVTSAYGIGSHTSGQTYSGGSDVAGTINGLAATGKGQTLTGSTGAVSGLAVKYTGTTIGNPVGSVTITDSTVTAATIGGHAATWDPGTKKVTANAGTDLAGLSLTYNGATTTGNIGSVTVSMSPDSIASVSIDGELADWDSVTRTIRGRTGSRFAGLELGYNGTAASGTVGTLTVSGNIAVDLSIKRDLDRTVSAVQQLASAYNEVVKFVDQQASSGGALAGSGAVRSVLSPLKSVLLSNIDGLEAGSAFGRLSAAGVALSKTGTLDVDAAKLKEALTTNQADVERLFSTTGVPSTAELAYLVSSNKTLSGTYTVNVTQAATRAGHTGATLGTSFAYAATDTTNGDTLTIADAFTGKSQDYKVKNGASMDTIVSELNSLFANQGMKLSASKVVDGGGNISLSLASTEYGSAGGFTVSGAATAGLGYGAGPVTASGLDVQGSFSDGNGTYAATGKGQTLTGSAGATEGLAVMHKGSGTGAIGTIAFGQGATGALTIAMEPFLRANDGTFALQSASLDRSMQSLNRRIDSIQQRLDVRKESLLKQFARMEEAISKFNSQGSWLASQIQSLQPRNNNS